MNKDIILLIGMPGCGKTTIGKELAKDINYDFYDMDNYIEEVSNKTIKELFNINEEHFRDYETRACAELSNKNKAVISTGGGIIKRKKNIELFKGNSIIIFIDRQIEDIANDIDINSRPLLAEGKSKLYNLYLERYNLYNKYCDFKIVNDGTINDIVYKIKSNIYMF
ncbi:shikimate kinase [Clostridium sp. CTA-7]